MSTQRPNTSPSPDGIVEMTPAQRIRSDWKAALARISYGAIVNNIPYFAFVALLGVVYISCNTTAVERQREIEKQQVALKELRWRYMDTKTRLMATGVEAEVIRRSAAIGLKPLMLPAYTIPKENGITDFPEPSQPTTAQ